MYLNKWKTKLIKKLSKYVITTVFSCIYLQSYAQDFSKNYKDKNGQYKEIKLTTTVNDDGHPYVSSYKDNNGNWKNTEVVAQVCGLDKNSRPIICNPSLEKSINLPNGISGLDQYGNVTSSIATKMGNFGGDSPALRPTVALSSAAPDALSGWNNSVFIGGLEVPSVPGQPGYSPLNNGKYGIQSNLNILGMPDGPFNLGCTLCLMSTMDSLTQAGGRAAISGADWRYGASYIQSMENFDTVSQYDYAGNIYPKLSLKISSFDKNGVTLSNTLTQEQISILHKGQYVLTNIINPDSVNIWPKGELPSNRIYGGIITGWENNNSGTIHIDVSGWAVPGGVDQNGKNLNSPDQIPDPGKNNENIDSYFSKYPSPMIFIGSSQKMFMSNWMLSYIEPDSLDNYPSTVHEFDFGEWDFNYKVNTAHSIDFSGLVINPQKVGGSQDGTNPFTARSQDIWLGGAVPTIIKVNPNEKSVLFSCDRGLDNNSDCNSGLFINKWNANDDLAPTGTPKIGNEFLPVEFESLVGGSKQRLAERIVQTGLDPNAGNDIRFGIQYGGTYGKADGTSKGTLRFPISTGAWSLCTNDDDSKCLSSDIDGNINTTQNINSKNLYSENLESNSIIGKESILGNSYLGVNSVTFNSDKKILGGQGLAILWNIESGSGTTNFVNVNPGNTVGGFKFCDTLTGNVICDGTPLLSLNSVESVFSNTVITNSNFRSPLRTPSSSNQNCTPGDFEDDENYHYVCVSLNKWKRSPLSDF